MKKCILFLLSAILFFVTVECHKDISFQAKLDLLGLFHHGNLPRVSRARQLSNLEEPVVDFIDQKLDHFNSSDTRTFKQRYAAFGDLFKRYGPIIIFIHAQEDFYPEQITGGILYDLAEEFEGYLFYLEHRYYGKSRPFEVLNMDNLLYMRVDQVLADVSEFIRIIRELHPEFSDSDVILTGGGGSATYATWHRVKYPELSAGAYASSGALEVKANIGPEFRSESGRVWRKIGGDKCYDQIQFGFEEIERLVEERNVAHIEKTFNMCHPFDVDNEGMVGLFYHAIMRHLSTAVPASGGRDLLETICNRIESIEDGVEIIASAVDELLSLFECFNVNYEEFVEIERNETLDYIARPLFYISCNDFVSNKAGGSPNQPFGNQPTEEFYVQWCADVFDQEFTMESYESNGRRLNAEYGGKKAQLVNVYTTQGELDPGRVLGKEKDVNPLSPTDIIPNAGAAHDIFWYFYPRSEAIDGIFEHLVDIVDAWL